jgi:hypothetical protein
MKKLKEKNLLLHQEEEEEEEEKEGVKFEHRRHQYVCCFKEEKKNQRAFLVSKLNLKSLLRMFYLYSFQSIQFFEEHMPNMFVVSNAYAYFGT